MTRAPERRHELTSSARARAMYLLRMAGLPYREVGRAFGVSERRAQQIVRRVDALLETEARTLEGLLWIPGLMATYDREVRAGDVDGYDEWARRRRSAAAAGWEAVHERLNERRLRAGAGILTEAQARALRRRRLA